MLLRVHSLLIFIALALLNQVEGKSRSIPSQISVLVSAYELRRPLRYSYYRLNSKLEINPIVGHIAKNNNNFCSSKLGPFCLMVNNQSLQQFQINQQKLNQTEKNSYIIEKHYQPYRFQATVQIQKTKAFFLTPSNQYKMIDAVVKKNIKSLMYSEVTADYLAEEDKKHQRKNAKAK